MDKNKAIERWKAQGLSEQEIKDRFAKLEVEGILFDSVFNKTVSPNKLNNKLPIYCGVRLSVEDSDALLSYMHKNKLGKSQKSKIIRWAIQKFLKDPDYHLEKEVPSKYYVNDYEVYIPK